MRHTCPTALPRAFALAALVALAVQASAQSSGGTYRIDAAVLTPGGALSGGGLQLRGSFGQPLAGASSAAAYRLNGGFVGADDLLFRSGFEYQ